ncbi:MAG: outer membrane homotrimeric porin, partial [Desulfovibrio sp.]|nr:outer membrane homotrimeric porin [Desulfovibrio sp.]
MKRITVLLLAMALMLGSFSAAKADGVDVKVKGNMWFSFGWLVNEGFASSYNRSSNERTGDRSRDSFHANQRLRTQINFIINEYLQGVALFEITLDWGRGAGTTSDVGGGGQINADGANVVTKHLYLDWIIPNTPVQVRMGMQPIALPSGPVGQPVLNADVAGITVSSPITDWLGITFVWARPFDPYQQDGLTAGGIDSGQRYDEVDAFALILPMSFRNIGLDIKPWFMWANIGASSGYYNYAYGSARNRSDVNANAVGVMGNGVTSNDRAAAWWLGTNLRFNLLDPLVFNFDVIYGSANKNSIAGFVPDPAYEAGYGTRGWFLSASLDYKLNLGNNISLIPGIFGWWASGDGDNAGNT